MDVRQSASRNGAAGGINKRPSWIIVDVGGVDIVDDHRRLVLDRRRRWPLSVFDLRRLSRGAVLIYHRSWPEA